MNWSQYAGILRIVLPAAASFAIGKGWITQDMYTQVGSALALIVASGGWSASANTDASIVKTASVVQGVEPIKISAYAAPALKALAADESVPTVKPADPPVYNPSQRR